MSEEQSAGEAFSNVYSTDHWDGGSGVGSQSELNDEYRSLVQALVGACDIASVVDAGCGDWQFSQLIDWSSVRYRGFDVVNSVVDANKQRFTKDGVQFEQLDFSREPLPKADLLLCKDVLQHWPVDSVSQFLQRNLRRFRYALITNDVWSVHSPDANHNADITFGEWRTLDIQHPPFSLRARAQIDLDYIGEWTKRAALFCGQPRALLAKTSQKSGLLEFKRAIAALR